jgi:hypothetical protein
MPVLLIDCLISKYNSFYQKINIYKTMENKITTRHLSIDEQTQKKQEILIVVNELPLYSIKEILKELIDEIDCHSTINLLFSES